MKGGVKKPPKTSSQCSKHRKTSIKYNFTISFQMMVAFRTHSDSTEEGDEPQETQIIEYTLSKRN